MVTRRLLMVLRNNLVFASGADRRYQREFAQSGAKIGATLNIRKPARFAVNAGPTLNVQNYVEETIPLVVDQQHHVDVEFTSVELSLAFDDWSRRVGEPEAIKLANTVDMAGLGRYWEIANSVISPDTDKWKVYLYAGALLDAYATPRDDRRSAVLAPLEQASIVNENKGLFQQATEIGRQYTEGTMGRSAGFKWSMDQNVAVHTTGSFAGAPVPTAAGQVGSSITTTGWTASQTGVLKKGDVIQFPNVYGVNPQSLASTGRLQDFTVLADVNSAAGGTATVTISPAIILAPDPRQTVTAAPGTGAIQKKWTASTAYAQNLVYHETAPLLATVDLEMPFSGQASRMSDPDAGIALRVWRDSNINTDSHPSRADVLYGWAWSYPECCVRVWSKVAAWDV